MTDDRSWNDDELWPAGDVQLLLIDKMLRDSHRGRRNVPNRFRKYLNRVYDVMSKICPNPVCTFAYLLLTPTHPAPHAAFLQAYICTHIASFGLSGHKITDLCWRGVKHWLSKTKKDTRNSLKERTKFICLSIYVCFSDVCCRKRYLRVREPTEAELRYVYMIGCITLYTNLITCCSVA